jgi:hypothetical protein
MTGQTSKPSPRSAWGMTVAAALDLFAFVLVARASSSSLLIIIFGLCEVVLILSAAGAWKAYFENFISHKLSEKSDAEQDVDLNT